MSANAADKKASRSNWRCASITGAVLLALLAVAWALAGRASASAATQAGDSGKQSAQSAPSEVRPGLPASLLGYNASPPQTGSEQPASSGKGQAANQHTGIGLGQDLPALLEQQAKRGNSGTTAPAVPAPVASATCGPEWSVVTTPNYPLHSSYLYAVAEAGPNDVWAGGYYDNDATPSESLPFFEHWNGSAWSVAAAPLPAGGVSGVIWSISVNTSGDVWAVGSYYDGTNTFELIERWNGIQWNSVTGSNPSATDNELYGVAVVSTNNVWAVGFHRLAGVDKTLVDHWNGATWTHVASPSHGTGDNTLTDISVVPGSSGSDIWAVGDYHVTPGGTEQTLTLHYDGTSWSYIVSLNQGAGDNALTGVYAISANDVWAVGTYTAGTANHTLAEHWTSSAWSIVTTVDPAPNNNLLVRVFATASNDVWAAGYSTTGMIPSPLIEHWNGTAWSVSTSATVGYATLLIGITGSSSSDLWTVGAYDPTSSTNIAETVIEHYSGTAWSPVYAPDAPTNYNILFSTSALSATDIWAVGFSQGTVGGTNTNQSVIEHWNGSSWSLLQSPHPTANGDQLTSVKAISANDVWAVGEYKGATNYQTLIVHWNGTTWSQITSPDPGGTTHDNFLYGVGAASTNDAWAVGYYDTSTSEQTLILHWNGSAWVQFSSPNPGANSNALQGVMVVPGSGGNDAWATGFYKNNPADTYSTLFERWNGTTWSVVASPNVGGLDNEPLRIFGLSANDVWAVGYTVDTSSLYRNLVLHWNGTSWSISPIVQQGPYDNQIIGGAALAPNDVYVVGAYNNAGMLPQSLIEHWDGSAWSVVPSVPSPGAGAALTDIAALSSSNMWAVGGYIPTGFTQAQTMAQHFFPCLNSCTITFTDVPVGSTFYPYIHCLACLGIVNGYPDGTFKPNANVTRGQLSKIVANSAGFNDPQTNQMFQDVPVGSTFQVYIGRLASRGYISGYACGGAGEPCVPPANLPYFRPNSNATRGQISKIVSNAAGFSDTPSGQQFQDVPVGSTYYAYIYRLVVRGVMSGYLCGGAGEPCVPPGNLPYFRPNNNATRGQTSKIVSGTFFPDCSSE